MRHSNVAFVQEWPPNRPSIGAAKNSLRGNSCRLRRDNGYVNPNLMLKVFDDQRPRVLQLSTTSAEQKLASKPDRSGTESQICKIERESKTQAGPIGNPASN